MTKRRTIKDPLWEPMVRVEADPRLENAELLRATGINRDEIEMWQNHTYTVIVGRAVMTKQVEGGEDVTINFVHELAIRRNDRHWPRDWRDFQRIKDQIAGEDVEAMELYPRKDRIMDTANQFYLWCLPPGNIISLFNGLPCGFALGLRMDDPDAPFPHAVQRPFASPDEPGVPWKDWEEKATAFGRDRMEEASESVE